MKPTAEEQAILDMKIPEDMQKEAAEQVKLAGDLYAMGFDKMASDAADALDEEEKEEEEEKKKESEKTACDAGMEKEAQERAAFIARGYIDGLKKEGQARHGDELHYLYPFIAEKLAVDASKLKGFMKTVKNKAVGAGKQVASDAKKAVTGLDRHGQKLDAAARLNAAKKPAAVAGGLALSAAAMSKLKKDDK